MQVFQILWHLPCQNKLRNITLKIALSFGSMHALGKTFLKLKIMDILKKILLQNQTAKLTRMMIIFQFLLIFTPFNIKSRPHFYLSTMVWYFNFVILLRSQMIKIQ